MKRANLSSFKTGERGTTLIELLVGLLIVSVLSSAVIASFIQNMKDARDHHKISKVNEQARTLIDYISYDMRMMGAGMPLGQSGFPIGGAYGNEPNPILTTSTATNLTMRLNEHGSQTVLSATYTPSSSSLTFSVINAADLSAGDTIYISNLTVGGTSGMKGTVAGVSGNNVTLSSYTATTSASFVPGSTVDRVTTIVLNSPTDWSGITRDAENGVVNLQANSQFTLVYQDAAGAALTLPMTDAVIRDNLASIKITVTVRSADPLQDGSTYTTSASKVVTLRNLILSR